MHARHINCVVCIMCNGYQQQNRRQRPEPAKQFMKLKSPKRQEISTRVKKY